MIIILVSQFCWEQGGFLVEINDSDESEFLKMILTDELNYWTGLTDLAEEGRFVWQESHTEASWTNWAEGEPNNFGNEDCVALERRMGHLWDDVGCDGFNAHALCETTPM